MKEHIISEIRRVAAENGGKAPGREAFSRATGIGPGKWLGVYWAAWGEALAEAGFLPNELTPRSNSQAIVRKIAEICLEIGRMPSTAELRLRRRSDESVPSHSTIDNHFKDRSGLARALREFATKDSGFSRLLQFIPEAEKLDTHQDEARHREDGVVYLLKHEQYYKIGHTDTIERRIREITVALPEKVALLHAIKTDDPPGIEAYWHKRFADRRANGEWFRLSAADVKAFMRRKFQ